MKTPSSTRQVSAGAARKAKKRALPAIVKTSSNGHIIELGKYVVSDPKICHGYLTFKGTRVMVGPVLAALAEGRNKKSILRSWPRLTWEAVQEAQLLAVHRLIFDFTGGKRLWLAYLQDALEKTSQNRKN
jgi:uncharacterized protein (DUF433 family)